MSQVEWPCVPLAWAVRHSVLQIRQCETALFYDAYFLDILSKCVLGTLKNVVLNTGVCGL